MSRTEELLAQLPADAQRSVRAALAARSAKNPDPRAASSATLAAFDAVGFPKSRPAAPVFPRASELTPAQRALAELKAIEGLPVFDRMPSGDASLRWLGLAPAGPLETEVDAGAARVPLWLALQRADDRLAVLDALPLPLALDALATFDGEVWVYKIRPDARLAWRSRRVRDLKEDGRGWALAVMAEPVTEQQPTLRRQLAFFALVRAGVAIAPEWADAFPISTESPTAVVAECAPALPLARLEASALPLLQRTFGPVAIQHALALLGHHDSAALARFVIELSKRSFPHHRKAEMAALAEIARRQPSVRAVLTAALGKAPRPRVLTVTARRSPRSPEELTPMQAKQLVVAGQRWDGRKLPVERRLSLDENDEGALGAVLEHLEIAEAGKNTFDAWLVAGDSGTFFSAGTTKWIAERIQGGIQLAGKPDDALRDALSGLSESKGAIRSQRDVAAATAAGKKATPAAKTKKPAQKTKKPAQKTKKPARKTKTHLAEL